MYSEGLAGEVAREGLERVVMDTSRLPAAWWLDRLVSAGLRRARWCGGPVRAGTSPRPESATGLRRFERPGCDVYA